MRLTDAGVILKGFEIVGKSFVNLQRQELNEVMKTYNVPEVTKHILNALEDKVSCAISTSLKPGALKQYTSDAYNRSQTILEGFRQYSSFVISPKQVSVQQESFVDLDIEHPIIHQAPEVQNIDVASTEMEKSYTPVKDSRLGLSKNMVSSESSSFSDASDLDISPVESETESETKKQEEKKLSHSELQQFLKPKQALGERARERKVPATRVSRLLSYGSLAAGIGLGAAVEVTKRTLGLSQSSKSTAQSLLDQNPFLSEANANRIVDTLCKVRGAALKLGQMLSLQDNVMINSQLAIIFERVRQSADFMPYWQMERVMTQEFGPEWRERFAEFESRPFAAASIGQVHRAVLHDGTEVALKIQYPGVAEGINSDINSLMGIVSLWNILPKGLFIENVMSVAERELKNEVDYKREAESAKKFQKLLESDPQFVVPKVFDDHCTSKVLTMELIYGSPVDTLIEADQDLRNMVGKQLLRLCLKEIFIFNFMQTDPNWSNFFYNPETGKIALLDFGASREYSPEFVDGYLRIIKAAADQDHEKVLNYSREMGFLTGYETKVMEQAHTDAVMILGEAFASKKPFDFGKQSMTHRIHHLVPIMLQHRLTPPPEESYSLHRKMSGIFLLCTKLRAVIDCRKLFKEVMDQYSAIHSHV